MLFKKFAIVAAVATTLAFVGCAKKEAPAADTAAASDAAASATAAASDAASQATAAASDAAPAAAQ
ncbi:hypothetical protein P256_01035 [Acinetobacter nectaris CIP 110549]|uniref:Lipoprotein n=1 Tax=Acinetobacter nectaris CIP 110549 TaxID=1392540 RepID=V2TXI3_9GAMM|nr:hypothetical protein [Acinetobacter nectaris]ESK40580.1 hypothetical protein P256_01035 [Acinetobacter nectaris CIP 110549]